MSDQRTDFRVEQSYDELEQACRDAVYSALLPATGELEPPPSESEQKWAEEIAERAASVFANGLDEAYSEDDHYQELARLRKERSRWTATEYFIRWIADLDAPDSLERRTVTLQRIIDLAKQELDRG